MVRKAGPARDHREHGKWRARCFWRLGAGGSGAEQVRLRRPAGGTVAGGEVNEEAIDPIQGEDVKVDVEVHRAAEAPDEGDGAGAGAVFVERGGAEQVRGEAAVQDAQDLAQGTRVGGAEQAQRDGQRQHPLAQRQRRQRVIDRMVKVISPAAAGGRSDRLLTRLDVPADVLDHHDRIVDHETDRDRESHEGEIVQAVAEDVHHTARADQRHRNGDARDHSGPEPAQEKKEHGHHEPNGDAQCELHVRDRRTYRDGPIPEHVDGDRRGKLLHQRGQARLHLIDHAVTRLPVRSPYCPVTTTRSPAESPRVTTTSCPLVAPVVMGRCSTVKLNRSTQTNEPRSLNWIARAGTVMASCSTLVSKGAFTNSPGLRSSRGCEKIALSRTVVICGSMRLSVSASWPEAILARSSRLKAMTARGADRQAR